MKRLKALALVGVAGAIGAMALSGADTYTNPVFHSQYGSPFVTAFRDDDGGIYGAIYQCWGRYSRDLVNWEDRYQTYETAAWYGDGSYTALWPSIHKYDGHYRMYYSIGHETSSPWAVAVGMGVSSSPQGFYSHDSALCTAGELGLKAVNQPFMMADRANGTKYLFVASPEMGIYALELTADGRSLSRPGEKIQITSQEMQCPRITYHDGYYYLFAQSSQETAWSNGEALKTIVVGRSENITGPYVNAVGDKMLDGYYHTVFSGNLYFENPSNFSPLITDDEGVQWLVYNARPLEPAHTELMIMLDRVSWVDGWPMINDGTPSYYPVKAPVIR